MPVSTVPAPRLAHCVQVADEYARPAQGVSGVLAVPPALVDALTVAILLWKGTQVVPLPEKPEAQPPHVDPPAQSAYWLHTPTHEPQGPPFGPMKPALQRQPVRAPVALLAVPLLAGQATQLTLPLTSLYALIGHGEHGPPLGPV